MKHQDEKDSFPTRTFPSIENDEARSMPLPVWPAEWLAQSHVAGVIDDIARRAARGVDGAGAKVPENTTVAAVYAPRHVAVSGISFAGGLYDTDELREAARRSRRPVIVRIDDGVTVIDEIHVGADARWMKVRRIVART